MSDLLKVLITVGGTIVCGYFLLRGSKFTATKAKEGVEQASQVDAQQSALDAWEKLLQPYLDEVDKLRKQVTDMKFAQDAEHERREEQVIRLTERIDTLILQLSEWKRLARVIARWATTLRDELIRQGGQVPATPEELLTLQAIDDADPLT